MYLSATQIFHECIFTLHYIYTVFVLEEAQTQEIIRVWQKKP